MSTIKISELYSAGCELFQDIENFLNELNEKESTSAIGGNQIYFLNDNQLQGYGIVSQGQVAAVTVTMKTVVTGNPV
jgi:hypothetical protein